MALESCEFWSAFCEAAVSQPDRLNPEVLRPFLGRLVPVLLKNMVSSILVASASYPDLLPLHQAQDTPQQGIGNCQHLQAQDM